MTSRPKRNRRNLFKVAVRPPGGQIQVSKQILIPSLDVPQNTLLLPQQPRVSRQRVSCSRQDTGFQTSLHLLLQL